MHEAWGLAPSMNHLPHPSPGEMKSLSQGKAGSNENIMLRPTATAGRHTPGREGPPGGCTCCDYREGLSQGSGHCGWPWVQGGLVLAKG